MVGRDHRAVLVVSFKNILRHKGTSCFNMHLFCVDGNYDYGTK